MDDYTPLSLPLSPLRLGNGGVCLLVSNEGRCTLWASGRVRMIIRRFRRRFRRFLFEMTAYICRLAMEDAVRPGHPEECE